MSYTNGLDKPTDYFNTVLYTGTGSSQAITGVGHAPNFVWIKCRDDSHNNQVFDSVRGVHKRMRTDTDGAETESSESLKSFDSDGFTLGTQANVNNSSNTFVSWNWLAGGTASSNSNGSTTSNVSANTTAGFSIVTYSGTNNNETIGHGLGVAPKVIFFKNRTLTKDWTVYHGSLGNAQVLNLNNTNAASGTGQFNSTSPTSTVFSVGGGYGNVNTATSSSVYVAYCFAEKKSFSKFGTYKGNGSNDGQFFFLGFQASFVMIKKTSATENWSIYDTKRNVNGTANTLPLNADNSDVESGNTGKNLDILSNGIKIRTSNGELNTSGGDYIFMAFAENPFVTSTGIPTTAR